MSEQQTQQQPVFSIEKIYVKDMSLEVPNAPGVFLLQVQPEIDIKLTSEAKQVDDGYYNCHLAVTVTATIKEKDSETGQEKDTCVFLAETVQSGIFQIRHIPTEELEPILGVACPNILFPYAREAVSNMVNRAGFPPVLLSPINFEALYMEQRAAQHEAGNA